LTSSFPKFVLNVGYISVSTDKNTVPPLPNFSSPAYKKTLTTQDKTDVAIPRIVEKKIVIELQKGLCSYACFVLETISSSLTAKYYDTSGMSTFVRISLMNWIQQYKSFNDRMFPKGPVIHLN
jgi:hypothetical protein